MSRSRLLVTILKYFFTSVLLFLIGPYVLGTAYSVVLYPFYGLVCDQATGPLDAVAHTQAKTLDFVLFLQGCGCQMQKMENGLQTNLNPEGGAAPSDPSHVVGDIFQNLGAIGADYHGMHEFYSDDLVGNAFSSVFKLLAKLIKEQFLSGSVTVAIILIPAMRNPLFKAFVYIFYSALATLALLTLNSLAKHIFHKVATQEKATNNG